MIISDFTVYVMTAGWFGAAYDAYAARVSALIPFI